MALIFMPILLYFNSIFRALGCFGSVLGCLGNVLDRPERVLGCFGAVLGCLGGVLGTSWRVLGRLRGFLTLKILLNESSSDAQESRPREPKSAQERPRGPPGRTRAFSPLKTPLLSPPEAFAAPSRIQEPRPREPKRRQEGSRTPNRRNRAYFGVPWKPLGVSLGYLCCFSGHLGGVSGAFPRKTHIKINRFWLRK